jgi:hypothetical protein
MGEEITREPEMGLTFEKVWAMFQETDRRMKETDRQMKETDRRISKLGSRVGDLVEELIVPNILEKFNKLGCVFGKVAPNVRYTDPRGRYLAGVDLLLENGDTVRISVPEGFKPREWQAPDGDEGRAGGP